MADERLLQAAQEAEQNKIPITDVPYGDTSPGSPGARSKLKSELGFTEPEEPIDPIPNEMGESTVRFIEDYEKQINDFGEGSELNGLKAEEVLVHLKDIQVESGKSIELTGLISAMETIAEQEGKPSMLHHIATGFEQSWDGLKDVFYGVSEGVRESEQGTLDAVFQPMLDLAGIRLTNEGVYISSPQAVELPEGSASQQVGKGLLQGKGTGWSGLPEDRVPLITIPGGPEPETLTGELARSFTQAGMSWYIGDKALNTAKALQTALPKLRSYFSTPAVQNVLNTATGEALTLQHRDRFATALVELGVDNEALKYIAGAPNEDAFTERFKSYLDGMYSAMGGSLIIEPFVKIGRAAYNMGWLGGAEKNPEKAAQLLDESERYVNKLLDIVPQVDTETGVFKVSDPLVSFGDDTAEQSAKKLEELKEELENAEGVTALDEEGERYLNKVLMDSPTVTQGEDIVLPAGKKAAPMQPEDVDLNRLFNFDPARDTPMDKSEWNFNFDKMSGTETSKEIIQRMFIQIQEKFPDHLRYGPAGKAETTLHNEQLIEKARDAEIWVRRNNINPERFIAGFAATTEELPWLMLCVRELAEGQTNYIHNLNDSYKALVKAQNGVLLPAQKLKYVSEMSKMMNMMADVNGSKRDIARTLQALNIKTTGEQLRNEQIQEIVKDFTGKLTDKNADKALIRLIDNIDKLPNVESHIKAFQKDNFTRLFDLINFNGINAYLGNLSTQTVNNVGSFAMINLLSAEKYIGAAWRAMPGVGGQGEITFDEANAHVFGVTQSLFESLFIGIDDDIFKRSAAGQGWKGFKELDTGLHNYDAGQLISQGSDERFLNLKVPEALNAKEVEEVFGFQEGSFPQYLRHVINGTGTIMGLPGRMLMSGDSFFRAINYRSAIHSLAMRRASEEGLQGAELHKRYAEIVKDLPQDIDEIAKTYAQVALFQENLDGGGFEKIFKTLERLRQRPLTTAETTFAQSALGNLRASFVYSKIPFLRTPYNIFKQTMIERNPVAALSRYVSDKNYRNKFHTDEAFKQDVLAKSTTGSMLMYLGYSLGGGEWIWGSARAKELMQPEGYDVSITGGANPRFQGRDIAQDQLRMQPEIFIRNMSTLDASSVPIGRADPIASLVMAGSIIGNYEAFLRNHVEPYQEIKDVNNSQLALDEANKRLGFAVGNFFMDKAMLRGVRDLFHEIFSTLNPNADYRKIFTNYMTKYAGQVPMANFFRGVVRATENQRYYNETLIKSEYVPTEEGDQKISTSGVPYSDLTEEKKKQLEIIDLLLKEYAQEWRKVNIMDMDLDSGDPIIRHGAVPMVDLEGNHIGFTDKEADIYERFLEQNLIPFSSKKVNETNTSVLIKNLDINFSHPKRWTKLTVGNEKIPLSPEQMLHWAVNFGRRNRNAFSKYNKTVKQLKTQGSALASLYPKQFLKMKTEIYQNLKMNKEAAKWDMIMTYPDLNNRYIESTIKNATETMIGE